MVISRNVGWPNLNLGDALTKSGKASMSSQRNFTSITTRCWTSLSTNPPTPTQNHSMPKSGLQSGTERSHWHQILHVQTVIHLCLAPTNLPLSQHYFCLNHTPPSLNWIRLLQLLFRYHINNNNRNTNIALRSDYFLLGERFTIYNHKINQSFLPKYLYH